MSCPWRATSLCTAASTVPSASSSPRRQRLLEGMGVRPQAYDPLVDLSNLSQVREGLAGWRRRVAEIVQAAPLHDTALDQVAGQRRPAA